MIPAGSYDASKLSQGDRNSLWQHFGHSGEAPVGYGGEGGSAGGMPTFNFDYKAAEDKAFQELAPYYERILKEENGDVDRAKARIQEDYSRGVRYRAEDQATKEKEFGLTFPKENLALTDQLNQRGLYPTAQSGGVGSQDITNLQESQRLRREAVTRALSRQGDEAGITKDRGVEDLGIKQSRTQFELGEQRKQRAIDRSTQMGGIEYQKYGAELNRYQATQSAANLDSALQRALLASG